MNIALIQQPAGSDREGNRERGLLAARTAAESGAKLICFAELAFDRFFPQEPAAGDVTGLAEVTGSYVMYSPTESFEEGEHIITIEIRDGSGRKIRDASWLFYTLNGRRQDADDRI